MVNKDRDLSGLLFDELLDVVTPDDIAAAWCRYTDGDAGDRDADWWAVDFFFSTELLANRELHRSMILKLLDHTESDRVIGCIAAGPLEDFLSDDESDLEWIELEAARNEKLRRALAGVWAKVSDQTFERLDRAAGTSLPRPLPREEWSPEMRAFEDAQARLVAVAGQDWWTLTDDMTPEQDAAVKEFLQAMQTYVASEQPQDGDNA